MTQYKRPTPLDQIPEGYEPMLVSTPARVYFGYTHGRLEPTGGVAVLHDFRRATNIVRWGKASGPGGLASHGPVEGTQIEAPSDMLVLTGVVAIRPVADWVAARFNALTPVEREDRAGEDNGGE